MPDVASSLAKTAKNHRIGGYSLSGAFKKPPKNALK